MSATLESQTTMLRLHTRLFENCLEGVDDDTAQQRPDEHTNHLAFLACHLVDARFFLARLLGSTVESPFKELDEVRRVQDMRVVPPLAALRHAWAQGTATLSARFAAVTDAELAKEPEPKFPIDDRTLLGAITFLLHHEAYHIGQMAMLRKRCGLRPMRYD